MRGEVQSWMLQRKGRVMVLRNEMVMDVWVLFDGINLKSFF